MRRRFVDDSQLLEFDPVDALKRVGGNQRLYRELLVKFAAKYADADSQIASALQDREGKALFPVTLRRCDSMHLARTVLLVYESVLGSSRSESHSKFDFNAVG